MNSQNDQSQSRSGLANLLQKIVGALAGLIGRANRSSTPPDQPVVQPVATGSADVAETIPVDPPIEMDDSGQRDHAPISNHVSRPAMSANLSAMLSAIYRCEGADYNTIVTGIDGKAETFDNFATHPFADGRPAKIINSRGLRSTASGAPQILLVNYVYYKRMLNLADFGPVSQDLIAVQMIREKRALALIEAGNIRAAVPMFCKLWASMPGAGYGQREIPIEQVIEYYTEFGGVLS